MSFEPAPLVSVVVPCRNHARFLGEALRSALALTKLDRSTRKCGLNGKQRIVPTRAPKKRGVQYA